MILEYNVYIPYLTMRICFPLQPISYSTLYLIAIHYLVLIPLPSFAIMPTKCSSKFIFHCTFRWYSLIPLFVQAKPAKPPPKPAAKKNTKHHLQHAQALSRELAGRDNVETELGPHRDYTGNNSEAEDEYEASDEDVYESDKIVPAIKLKPQGMISCQIFRVIQGLKQIKVRLTDIHYCHCNAWLTIHCLLRRQEVQPHPLKRPIKIYWARCHNQPGRLARLLWPLHASRDNVLARRAHPSSQVQPLQDINHLNHPVILLQFSHTTSSTNMTKDMHLRTRLLWRDTNSARTIQTTSWSIYIWPDHMHKRAMR